MVLEKARYQALEAVVGPESRLKPRVDETVEEVTASARRITNNIAEFFQAKGVIAYGQMMR